MLSLNTIAINSKKHLLFVLIVFSLQLSGQELPPIQHYSPQVYKADDQNWSISQDENENIYVANNKGLLEFNGARWILNRTPNQSIVRSVAVIDSLIYTGSYMDFGFWKRNKFGNLQYTSIVNQLDQKLEEDEEFWNIIPYDKYVLFQSLDKIYIYNTEVNSFKVIDSKAGITKAFKIDNAIYFQDMGVGIFKIENGKSVLLTDNNIVKNQIVVNVFKEKGMLLFQTRNQGFFKLEGNIFSKWDIPANNIVSNVSVYNSLRLRDGSFVLGTISNGIIKLTPDGEIDFQINRKNGLSNNTILSVFQDVIGNVWLGLDNGIATLNLNSPYKIYSDLQGDLGTVYASVKTDDYLYLGTNQGLFYKANKGDNKFKLIPNTKGQVWSLKQLGDSIWCGHDTGAFIINNTRALKIIENVGTWLVNPFLNDTDVLISGSYDGLRVLKKSNNGLYSVAHKIEGFNISSRYFEFVDSHRILVSHEYKGVYLLNLNTDLTRVENYKKLEIEKGIGSSLVKFDGKIYYAYQKGVFQFNPETNKFLKTSFLDNYFNKSNYISGKFVLDERNNRLWNFFNNQLTYLESGKLTDEPIVSVIDLPNALRKSKPGFENIIHLSDNRYLLGATNGYIIIDTATRNLKEYSISIDNVLVSEQLQNFKPIDLTSSLDLKNKQNNLNFNYSISDFVKLSPALYQYRLIGIYDSWSDWSKNSSVIFENLPHGTYTFEVRAKSGSNLSTNTATFNFEIEKPWYLKPLAIVSYVILFLVIATSIQYFNKLYYQRQQKRIIKANEKELEIKELETQQQLMAFKNETLQKDIESKNRELGLSTMTLIRKNEFLNSLKKELNALESSKELTKIIKIIDKNINNNEDWKFFEEAFNNADKDFLKKVKKRHPSLTPNDLKLCAYLRLNLASKEIAPLLNISHRSVEVKRYRLRKKMELPHEASLTNYILDI